jgi:hypothetical protein
MYNSCDETKVSLTLTEKRPNILKESLPVNNPA